MSLVGTRPILQDELQKYELHHRARIAIKPGITGMWQVSGRSDITDFEEVVRLDTEYISNWTFEDCFVGQPAVEKVHNSGFLIWGSSEPNTINVVGIIIIVLIVVAVIWNRDSLLCKISASWIGFSVLLLCVLGWGTSSNALFLYSLYFSWAFWVPFFLSFQKIYNKGYKKSVIVILT